MAILKNWINVKKLIAMLLAYIPIISMEVLIYVISNLGFQLFYPFTLPFISYGVTGTIINMWILGIMLSVFKSGEVVKDNFILSIIRKGKLFEFVDGKISIYLNSK